MQMTKCQDMYDLCRHAPTSQRAVLEKLNMDTWNELGLERLHHWFISKTKPVVVEDDRSNTNQ